MATPTITNLSPNSGPPEGNTIINIAGSGFTGATGVTFGTVDLPPSNMQVFSDNLIEALSPAGTGSVDVTVTTPSGSSPSVAAAQFHYVQPVPVVTAINPASGPAGSSVTITGQNLTGAVSVNFGLSSVSSLTVPNDTTIIVTAPVGSGTVDVTVVTPLGLSAANATDKFTYALSSTGTGTGTGATTGSGTGTGTGSGTGTGTGTGTGGGGGGGSTGTGTGTGTGSGSGTGTGTGSGTGTGTTTGAGTGTGSSGGTGSGTGTGTGTGTGSGTIPTGSTYVPGGLTGLGGTDGTGVGFGVGTLLPGGGGSSAPSNLPYYVDPALTAGVVQSLMGVLQNATSPDAMEAQNILLRRMALEGDVVGSRVPPPRNITEIGGYINLLGKLQETTMRQQVLAGILSVAGPTQPLGWISNNQPLAMVGLPNDRPAGVAQASFSLTFLVRSDFQTALQAILKSFRTTGATIPFQGSPPIVLPVATSGAAVPADLLFYLGRTLTLATTAALINPATDPLALVRPTGTLNPFAVAARVLAPGLSTVAAADYDGLACTTTSCAPVPLPGVSMVPLAPTLALAGFYPPSPPSIPASNADKGWARFTNITGLVPGVTKLGDELALLYRPDQIVNSVFAPLVNSVWNGTTFAS